MLKELLNALNSGTTQPSIDAEDPQFLKDLEKHLKGTLDSDVEEDWEDCFSPYSGHYTRGTGYICSAWVRLAPLTLALKNEDEIHEGPWDSMSDEVHDAVLETALEIVQDRMDEITEGLASAWSIKNSLL